MQKNCNFQTHLKYNLLLKLFKILSITVTSLLLIVISFLHYQQFPIYEWEFILEYIKDNRQKEDFNSIATKLGYHENDKLLIIHADDVGLSKSVNESTFESFKNESITSASIIMNTYEMEEGLKFAVENPNFDFEMMYEALRKKGVILYPGAVTQEKTFRIGCIGDINKTDIDRALSEISIYLASIGLNSKNLNRT